MWLSSNKTLFIKKRWIWQVGCSFLTPALNGSQSQISKWQISSHCQLILSLLIICREKKKSSSLGMIQKNLCHFYFSRPPPTLHPHTLYLSIFINLQLLKSSFFICMSLHKLCLLYGIKKKHFILLLFFFFLPMRMRTVFYLPL